MQKARWSSLDQLRGRQRILRILWKIFLKLAREDIARKGCSRGDSYPNVREEQVRESGTCQGPFDAKTLEPVISHMVLSVVVGVVIRRCCRLRGRFVFIAAGFLGSVERKRLVTGAS